MLIYVGSGRRFYGDLPVGISQRRAWEFQAVLRGNIAPILSDGPDILRQKRLWLFPPRHLHGWTAPPGSEAEIVVFHFLSVPEPLLRLAAGQALEIGLNQAHCVRLRLLARQAMQYWKNPAPGSMICHEQALMELSLLVYEATLQLNSSLVPEDPARRIVQRAMEFFAENMQDNPSQEQLAREVGASPSHLRRLFHEVLQAPPKQIMDQLRFQRATQLMADAGTKLESIGEACGFGSASAFSRAFKIRFGCSPGAWRG